MVGGEVIETLEVDGRVFVDVKDRQRPKQTCAIYVENTDDSVQIKPGDALWWQGNMAMWTPKANRLSSKESAARAHKCGVHYDIQIPRVGYSGVPHPFKDKE